MKHDKILAGRVVNAHGVRGEVRVLPVEADLLARARALYLDGERRPGRFPGPLPWGGHHGRGPGPEGKAALRRPSGGRGVV